ncbi:hypothetical protein L596_001540 [Steinernema carpocapsae]|uniref:Uncharacterized protein n=1 Tax=Steinernema carpocapsae TaxID=34508 RepID=A0A4U8UMJ8_STECR|nr:hypothetical protein L596_001540 [Steinernema carpocapsae]
MLHKQRTTVMNADLSLPIQKIIQNKEDLGGIYDYQNYYKSAVVLRINHNYVKSMSTNKDLFSKALKSFLRRNRSSSVEA